jgi:quercetin dioxygenase-like cupin family protein
MYYSDSIYNPEFKKTRGYLCGSFDGAPIFSKNMEVGYMDYEELKNHIGDRHHHNVCDEMTIIIKGSMEEKIDGNVLKLKIGDFFFVSPGTITELQSIEEGTSLLVIKGPSVSTDKIKDK